VVATYLPAADSVFLPSTSLAKIHEVKCCLYEASSIWAHQRVLDRLDEVPRASG
jgi:hypothetical protein